MKIFQNKSLLAFLVIVGTVVGSGFLSGKEIVVFFSRFGKISFFCVTIAFFLFFALFYFFLRFGAKALQRLSKSCFARLLNGLICLSLCSAMFAGIGSLVTNIFFKVLVMGITLALCVFVTLKGSGALEKLNLILVPLMFVFLLVNLSNLLRPGSNMLFQGNFAPFGVFYSVLYVILNTSNSSIVISHYADQLTNKQKVQVSFWAALALYLILLFANIVLLQNSYAFSQDMPLLALMDGWQKVVMGFVILLGCCTTLFSLVCTISCNMKSKNKCLKIGVCVFLPFILSFLGFGFIVSAFYPLASIFGFFLLLELFLLPMFGSWSKNISKHFKGGKSKRKLH